MAIPVLILGESGQGKSTSMQHMDPTKTFLIQVSKKPLPFKVKGTGWGYLSSENRTGNIVVSDDSQTIIRYMEKTQRDVIVIDDFQYLLANEFMRRSDEKGFDKFTEIGRHAWDVYQAACNLPGNKRVYIMQHTQSDEYGNIKAKTIGKLLDEKVCVEGLFSIVMRTVKDGKNYFTTENNGRDTVKCPIGLFDSERIENDLAFVDSKICEYYDIPTTNSATAA